MELEGKISVVMPAASGISQSTGNPWMSQEYVMAYYWFPNQTNPSFIVMRVFGEDRIKQFNLQENDEVRVRFHIEAHEYNGRWFNEIRIDSVTFIGASASKNPQNANQGAQQAIPIPGGQQQAQPNQGQQGAPFPPKVDANGNPVNNNGNDDLPF